MIDAVRIAGLFLIGALVVNAYSVKKEAMMIGVPERTEEILSDYVLRQNIA